MNASDTEKRLGDKCEQSPMTVRAPEGATHFSAVMIKYTKNLPVPSLAIR